MSNPSGPDRDNTSNPPGSDSDAEATDPVEPDTDDPAGEQTIDADGGATETETHPVASSESDAATEVIARREPQDKAETDKQQQRRPQKRRFTAPGFDAKETAVINTAAEPATEVFRTPPTSPPVSRTAKPQSIPPRLGAKLPSSQRSWVWVLALIVIILALAVIAVFGTLLLTRGKVSKASQADQVRSTILSFDIAIQNGDLAALRSITCGTTRDGYVTYDESAWADTYRQVVAAKQYPVVASIDQVVVNGEHAEANVTTFLANAPQVRSTRSFDLQFRDNQWKICQSSGG